MSTTITGHGQPRFAIRDSLGYLVEIITLPQTNENGFIETYEERFIEHEFLNYNYERKLIGVHINFTFNYDTFISMQTGIKIGKLLRYGLNNYRIFLTPRIDIPSRYYEVIGQNNSLELKVLRGGIYSNGNKGVILKYKTRFLQHSYNWLDPITENFIIAKNKYII